MEKEQEKEKKAPVTSPAYSPANSPARAPNASAEKKSLAAEIGEEFSEGVFGEQDYQKTAGEKAFDEITYRGVDWLLNAALGATTTFLVARTKPGMKYFGEPVTNFFRQGLKPLIKNTETLEESAKWGRNFTSITAGGFLIIPPIMLLEKNKRKIVEKLDTTIYGQHQVDNDPRFEIAYHHIENEPPQDFKAGMYSRFLSLAPLLVATVAFPKTLAKYIYEPIASVSKGAAKRLGIQPKGMMDRMQPGEDGRLVSDWDFFHKAVGFDFGLTIFYAYLHEYTYKAFADYFAKDKPKEVAAAGREISLSPHAKAQLAKTDEDADKGKKVTQEQPKPESAIHTRDATHQPPHDFAPELSGATVGHA